jgi:glycosyltransferase involved in cell wall biosynthesis
LADKRLVSIIVPVYNEEEFVEPVIRRVLAAPLPEGLSLEIVAVNDGSSDSSGVILERLAALHPESIRFYNHPANSGKGAAVRTGLSHASGEFGIIQDSDLEYDPADYPQLLGPLAAGKADVVYGSRFLSAGERRVIYYWHSLANRILTTACNMAADLNLTDVETCYKAFRLSLVKSIPLRSNGFGIEPEMTIKLAKRQAAIYEVPVSYYGRTYEEGKKVGFVDAFNALYVIARYAFSQDIYIDRGARILDALSRTKRFNRWMASVARPWLGTDVLELGAGIGNLTRHLSPGRKTYAATDVDEEHLARLRVRFHGRPNLTVRKCDLSAEGDFEQLRGKFDTVACLNVLEHVEDDLKGLRNIYSALKPGGRAIVLAPQDPSIYGALDKVLGHRRRYTEEELRKKMTEAGFRIESAAQFNRITRPGWYVNGRIFKREYFGRVQLFVFDIMTPLWRRIDHWLPWKGVSIICVGLKA